MVLRNDSTLTDSLPFSAVVPWRDLLLTLPMESLLAGADVLAALRAVPTAEVSARSVLCHQFV